MQQAHEAYFLAICQAYMAKLIAGQVKTGESAKYHKVMSETYILSIGKKDLFKSTGASAVIGDGVEHYEKTVTPMIHELGVTVPDNKMNWKFYELDKFKKFIENNPVTNNSPMKDQWLNFLLECQRQSKLPEDVDELIKKAYHLMEIEQWSEEERILYWKQQANLDDHFAQVELEREEAQKEGMEKGMEKGRQQEKIANAVRMFEQGMSKEVICAVTELPEGQLEQISLHQDKGVDEIFGLVFPQSVDISLDVIGDDSSIDS